MEQSEILSDIIEVGRGRPPAGTFFRLARRYLDAAERVLRAAWQAMTEHPLAHMSLLNALQEYNSHPEIIVIRGEDAEISQWRTSLAKSCRHSQLIFAIGNDTGNLPGALADREPVAGKTVAYRCISVVSQAAATVPVMLFSGDEEADDHPLLDLIKRTNPMQGKVEFFEALYGFFLIAGNSYVEAAMPQDKMPTELWTLRPDRMKVVPGKKGVPAAYEYAAGAGTPVKWEVDALSGRSPIMHMRGFHPTDDWYGFSPIEAAGYSIDQHNAASAWQKALLDNSCRPSGALVYAPKEGDLTLGDEQYARLKAQMEDQYSSKANAGLPMILDGGLDWKEMSISPKDMDWIKGKDVSAREIALAFGVPGQLVGVPDQATYSNNREARLALYEDTVLPLVWRALSHLNNWLVPMFGESLELRADIDEIAALVLHRERVWDRVQTSDFLTLNEKRAAVGYEEIEGGDVLLVPASLLPLGQAIAEPPPIPTAGTPVIVGAPEDEDENEKAGRLAYGGD